jgi:Subtilase family
VLSALGAPGAGRAGARRAVALGAAAAALACVTVAGAASPALADSVRTRQQWVLDAINAQAAWTVSQGQGVTVAVIDSGVNPDVPDLDGSVTPGPDLTDVGTPSSNPNWGMHGTWMASLIAGHGHDGGGSGIIGVAPQARILSIRVITDKTDPGYPAYQRQPLSEGQQELARGITDAVREHAGVISMSLGYGAPSRPVRVALQDAIAHNVVIVASSGNSGDAAGAAGRSAAPYSFPAGYPGVLGVGAVGPTGQPASFSSENQSVLVAAPGVNVPAEGRDSQYWLVSGTSPACALTAGVAALIKSKYPRLTDQQVSDAITGSAWRRPAGGYDQQVGFGTVNAAAALAAAARQAAEPGSGAGQDVASARHFGGGPAAVPAPPVTPRGSLALVAYCLLGVACLAAMVIAALRLVARQPSRRARQLAYSGSPPAAAPGAPRPREAAPYGSYPPPGTYPPPAAYPPASTYPPPAARAAGNGHDYPPGSDHGYPPGNGGGYPQGAGRAYPPSRDDGYPAGVGRPYPPGRDDGYPAGDGRPCPPGRGSAYPAAGGAYPEGRQPATAPLRPIPPPPAPAPPWAGDRPHPAEPDAGPLAAGWPARRPDAGPGTGRPPGAVRPARSSRPPGRHAAPPEPPPRPGGAP